MSDPTRIHDEGDAFETALLRSARAESPPEGANRRAAIAVGIAAASVSTGVGAAVGVTQGVATMTPVVVKWVSLAIIVAGLGAGSTYYALKASDEARPTPITHENQPAEAPPPDTAAIPQIEPAPDASDVSPEDASADVTPSQIRNEHRKPRPTNTHPTPTVTEALAPETREAEPPQTPTQRLSEEVAQMDLARAALAAGRTDEALQRLADYRREFPGGMLTPEADVLRIETLARRGESAAARREGERFLAAYPKAPQARRVRSILEGLPSGKEEGN